MLFTLALLAASAPTAAGDKYEQKPQYVANQIPEKALTLDASKICKNGYVDPASVTLQLMIQLDMSDEIIKYGVKGSLAKLDGSECPKETARDSEKSERRRFCNATIAAQRLMLNVYPGFRPAAPIIREDLKSDLSLSDKKQTAVLAAYTNTFLLQATGSARIRCDGPAPFGAANPTLAFNPPPSSGDPAPMDPDPKPETPTQPDKSAWAADSVKYLARDVWLVPAIEDTLDTRTFLGKLQWRQVPNNLIYRAGSSTISQGDATYLTGEDLYDSDNGFGVSVSETVKGVNKAYEANFQGALGIPLCEMIPGLADHCKAHFPWNKDIQLTWNVIPYGAIDYDATKTTSYATTPATSTTVTGAKQTEFGAVGFLSTQYGKGCWLNRFVPGLANLTCQSFFVGRAYYLNNQVDGSRFAGQQFRYVPITTTSDGAHNFDLCVNQLCGDPDRLFRYGLIGDVRIDAGQFDSRGDPKLPNFVQISAQNIDYLRAGYRGGVFGRLALLPDLPIDFWTAYTELRPIEGFRRDLGEFQAQAKVDFSPLSLSLVWRNGRREDTAQRDQSLKLQLSFKPKN
jgi:hypothetical protein